MAVVLATADGWTVPTSYLRWMGSTTTVYLSSLSPMNHGFTAHNVCFPNLLPLPISLICCLLLISLLVCILLPGNTGPPYRHVAAASSAPPPPPPRRHPNDPPSSAPWPTSPLALTKFSANLTISSPPTEIVKRSRDTFPNLPPMI